MRFAGVDIASETHVVAVVEENGEVRVKATPFGEDAPGYAKLLGLLGPASQVLIAMEATGHYWKNLFAALAECASQSGNAPDSRMGVISRVLGLRHVLNEMNDIAQSPKRRCPVRLAKTFSSLRVRSPPIWKYAVSHRGRLQGQGTPHRFSRIKGLVVILAIGK
jgi:hypothetical protein